MLLKLSSLIALPILVIFNIGIVFNACVEITSYALVTRKNEKISKYNVFVDLPIWNIYLYSFGIPLFSIAFRSWHNAVHFPSLRFKYILQCNPLCFLFPSIENKSFLEFPAMLGKITISVPHSNLNKIEYNIQMFLTLELMPIFFYCHIDFPTVWKHFKKFCMELLTFIHSKTFNLLRLVFI